MGPTVLATLLSCFLLYQAYILDRKASDCTYRQWKSLTKKRDQVEVLGFVVASFGTFFWSWGLLALLCASVFWFGLGVKNFKA